LRSIDNIFGYLTCHSCGELASAYLWYILCVKLSAVYVCVVCSHTYIQQNVETVHVEIRSDHIDLTNSKRTTDCRSKEENTAATHQCLHFLDDPDWRTVIDSLHLKNDIGLRRIDGHRRHNSYLLRAFSKSDEQQDTLSLWSGYCSFIQS
jgi:hypothetical protein